MKVSFDAPKKYKMSKGVIAYSASFNYENETGEIRIDTEISSKNIEHYENDIKESNEGLKKVADNVQWKELLLYDFGLMLYAVCFGVWDILNIYGESVDQLMTVVT